MRIFPFAPCGTVSSITATQTGGSNRVALNGTSAAPNNCQDLHVRVVNEHSVAAVVAFGSVTVDATTDIRALVVPAGAERVFTLPPGATYFDAIVRSTTGTVTAQVGHGV